MRKIFRSAASIALILLLGACGGPKLSDEQSALIKAAGEAGATEVSGKVLDDGGLMMTGKLEGRDFTVAFPWRWNHQAALFAYGYRPPGLPTIIPDNLLADDLNGFHRLPYADGFATGRSAYDKSGMAVQSGVEATYRLKQLLDKLGTTRTYIQGASMGGNITEALIEKYPQDFAGATAFCGAVGGWVAEISWASDVRAAYNYFTRGTPYELPGERSIAKSAVWMPANSQPKAVALGILLVQGKRLINPVTKLFAVAAANPKGPEQRIIDNIAAVSGAVADPAGFLQPITIMAMGTDDLNRNLGGSIVDNSAKVYSSPYLSVEENAALNAGIERIKADPQAVAKANEWHLPSGKYETRLLTVYNAIDPTAPSTLHEPVLHAAAERAGNLERLVQRSVPSKRDLIQGSDQQGYVHCGFTPDQVASAWHDLRAWVESGIKPVP